MRHFKHGRAQQSTLPVAALVLLACAWTGAQAVLWTGPAAAATVAVGVTLAQRERSGA